MDQDATWCGDRPPPGYSALDGHPAPPPKKMDTVPNWPASVVAKRVDESRCHLVGR